MPTAAASISLVVAVWCTVATSVRADDVRVEVATLDGTPVYHWRVFQSVLSDDVDRALVLREFQRKSLKLSPKLVDEATHGVIDENFGGNTSKFTQSLHQKGASLADFERFTSEEIMVKAMLYQRAGTPAEKARMQADWLARLRASATVKRLPIKTENGSQ